jgi:hypothetical protein
MHWSRVIQGFVARGVDEPVPSLRASEQRGDGTPILLRRAPVVRSHCRSPRWQRLFTSTNLRAARKSRLETLDIEALVAVTEGGNQATLARIAQEKQVLRDVPADPRIESAKTPDELKNLTLDVLVV